MTRFLTLFVGCLFAMAAHTAPVVGGSEVGWTLDWGQVTLEQKAQFGWKDENLKLDWKPYTSTYNDVPGEKSWQVAGKVTAGHAVKGPAFWTIVELYQGSVEDLKRAHYRAMSNDPDGKGGWAPKGFKEWSCEALPVGGHSCQVYLNNWTPPKPFYATFHSWKVGERTFVLTVRNAQPDADRKTPEAAMKLLMSLIKPLPDVGARQQMGAAPATDPK